MNKTILKKLAALLLTVAMLLPLMPLMPQILDTVVLDAGASDEYTSTINQNRYTVAPVYNDAIYNELKAEWIKYEFARTSTTMSIGPLFRTDEHPQTQMAWGYGFGGIYNMITGTKVVYEGTGTWTYYGSRYNSVFSDETVMRIGANSYSGGEIQAIGQNGDVLGTVKKGYMDVDYFKVEQLKTKANLTTPYAVAIDNKKPSITRVEMGGFDSITLCFSETLRPANGDVSLDEYTVTLSYANANSGVEIGKLVYRADSLDGDRMTFKLFGTSEPGAGEYRILSISGASNGAEDEKFDVFGIGQVYAYSIGYDKYTRQETLVYENNPLRFITTVDGKAPITDLAGNALTLPSSLDLRDYNINIDRKAPEIEKISMTGNMSPKLNETSRESWPDLIDLSSVFAGTDGDYLYFDVYFTEKMSTVGSITLNVQKNGVNVTLDNPLLSTSVNANGDTCTVARYGPLNVSEGMTMATGHESNSIQVIGTSGTYRDHSQNSLTGQVKTAAQKIYLDTTAPSVSASLYSGNGTRNISIQINMSDTGSGFLGLEGQIGLTAKTEGTVSYIMAITDTMTIPEDSAYKYSGTFQSDATSWQTIPLYNGTRYVHIKLIGNESTITVDELKVEYSLPDWAGNRNMTNASTVEPNYTYDETPPKVNSLSASVNYTDIGAYVTAQWSASDYNGEYGITTYYQWRDTKPADYSTGWMSVGEQTEGFAWLLPEEGYPEFDSRTDTTLTLWVYAIDKSGNKSEMVSKTVRVLLDKPNYSANFVGDPTLPTRDPSLNLSVEKGSSAGKEGYMRTFVSFVSSEGKDAAYSYTYAFVISSADTVNGAIDVFPLSLSGLTDRRVYRLTLNESETEVQSVATIGMAEFDQLLANWYGEVRVRYDLCYDQNATVTDNALVPQNGSLSALITDGSYYRAEDEVIFLHSCEIDDIYQVQFTGFTDAQNESFEQKQLFYQTLGGVSFDLLISNQYWPELSVRDVDFDRTVVSIVRLHSDGSIGETVITLPINQTAEQRITIPKVSCQTGVYTVQITLAMKDGQALTVTDDIRLVVDHVLLGAGVSETYITPNIPISSHNSMPSLIQFDENGKPYLVEGPSVNSALNLYDTTGFVIRNAKTGGYIKNMTVSMAGQSETIRTGTYTNEAGGILNFGFTVTAESAEQELEGFVVGKIAAIYVWNPAIHEKREQGFVTTDGYTFTYNSENAVDHDTWTYDQITGIGTSTQNQNAEGIYTMAQMIGLTNGNNVICIQVVMANGLESSVEKFTIYVNTETPSAGLDTSVLEEKLNLSAEGEPINVARADVSLQNVFTSSGIAGIYYLTKDTMELVRYTQNADGSIVETVDEYKYVRSNTLNDLNNGYYGQWKYRDFVMYNASYGDYLDADGKVVSDTRHRLYYQSRVYYYNLYTVGQDAIIRLNGEDSRTYMTAADGSPDECVTYKMGNNMEAASGAFMIVDASGACVLVFPQFAPTEDAYSQPEVKGYQPKYRLTGEMSSFNGDFGVSTPQYNLHKGQLEMSAWMNHAEYLDPNISYVVFTDAYGNELERFFLNGVTASPNTVGFDSGDITTDGAHYVKLYLQNPLADGDHHQVGDLVESVWAQLVLYDANTGREIRSKIIEVTHPERTYENPVPEPYWTDQYDGLRLNWDTSVYVGDGAHSNFNHKLNIFEDGDHQITVTDHFGLTQTVTVTTTHFAQFQPPKIEIDNQAKTTRPVTVTITVPNGAAYDTVSVRGGGDDVIIKGSDSDHVTVTFFASTKVTISWDVAPDDTSNGYMSYELEISNILPVDLAVRWDYGESAQDYLYGDVIAYVYDRNGNWDIVDPMTGKAPTYTFVYGSGITQYTFPKLSNGELLSENEYNDIGEFTVALEVELAELPPPPMIEIDTRAPSVQIIPFAMRNQVAVSRESYLVYQDLEERAQTGDETYIDILNPALVPYESYTAYTDAMEFTEALGWASRYRFNIEVQDLNKTRIVIRSGLYAEAPKSYYTATSDSVENVSLFGNTLEVTGPAQFTIFVIDEMGNVTAFRMNLYNVGNAPVPTYVKSPTTLGEDDAIRVDLSAPADGTDLKITAVDGIPATEAIFTKNGVYRISYSYLYQGEPVAEQLTVEVIEVDNDAPVLLSRRWSVQTGTPTKGEVVATLTFSKPIDLVQTSLSATELPDCVKVKVVGNMVTVRYSDNYDRLELYLRAVNGKWSDAVILDAVTNIDREAPVIVIGEPVYSIDGRKATVSIAANERVSFRESNSIHTVFNRTFDKNGIYEYVFVDVAGNATTATVHVTGIVDQAPTLSFSKSSDGKDAVAAPDELGEIALGDLFYVSVDRAATVSFNGESYTVDAGEWLALTLGDKSGGAIYARDTYGNVSGAVFSCIDYPDLVAPEMKLIRYTVHASMLDLSDLDQSIRANCEAVDDRDGNVQIEALYEMPTKAGEYTVTYTAKDKSGNQTVVTGLLRVYETTVPGVAIDGNIVERESIYIAQKDDVLMLSVDMQGEPYEITWSTGILTAAQMKIHATQLEPDEDEIALPFAGQSGYYTILVTTQSHDQYRINVYIQ